MNKGYTDDDFARTAKKQIQINKHVVDSIARQNIIFCVSLIIKS